MENKINSGVEALISICRELQMPYSFTGRFKHWRVKQESFTISIPSKTITRRGPGCQLEAIKAMVLYMVQTFSALADVREQVEEAFRPLPRPCQPVQMEIKKGMVEHCQMNEELFSP